jgi:hypothetical protein
MGLLDVRRLAAIDMHGVAGKRWRQRVILAEFILGAVVGVIIGIWVAVLAQTAGWQAFGCGATASCSSGWWCRWCSASSRSASPAARATPPDSSRQPPCAAPSGWLSS